MTTTEAPVTAPSPGESGPDQGRIPAFLSWCMVAATVAWSLRELRAAVAAVAYPDDNSLHQQMVRFATAQLRAGHDPLTSWFPYLGLGSPQFMHYQSAPAILTGLAGLVIGPDAAFRWSLYLLWCLWPVAIYGAARVFGIGRLAAGFAAVIAPLLHSGPGIGYEQHAYLWAGYGVWTQLWASWTLPFAWALTWRAAADRRFIGPAAGLVALTAALHFETGYLAFLGVLVLPLLARGDLRTRLGRGAIVLGTALLACAWVVVPLLTYARWAGLNQALAGTPMRDGYPLSELLSWLVRGEIFDQQRWPVVSLLVAAGLVLAVGWRRGGPGRALAVLLAASLLVAAGPATFGGLVSVIPGSQDLFFRRFLMGAQLAGIFLAGLGAAELSWRTRRLAAAGAGWLSWAPAAVAVAAGAACLFPAWPQTADFASANAVDVGFQQLAQADEPQVAAAAAVIRRHGPGRVYAGSPSGWGQNFRVGFVPMYAYLESLDLDEVGYTLRTASLMTQPEDHFDAGNAGDYAVFGIRYLMLPALPAVRGGPAPPPGAVLLLRDRLLRVYELPASSYFRVAEVTGSITADRANLGRRTAAYLSSAAPGQDHYLAVGYAGARPAAPTLPPGARSSGPPGTVLAEHADLTVGRASAVVRLHRPGMVVLSASFDPGWRVLVDGRPVATQMVSPALVAVRVRPGRHTVLFQYVGFAGYPWLLLLAVVGLVAVTVVTRRRPGQSRPAGCRSSRRCRRCPGAGRRAGRTGPARWRW
jgi:hypothetical protein